MANSRFETRAGFAESAAIQTTVEERVYLVAVC